MDVAVNSNPVDELLTEDQIEALLQKAEVRLREQRDNAVALTNDDTTVFIPRTSKNAEITKPFVASKGQVARVDSVRLLGSQERADASSIRKVEDPLVTKQKKLEEKKASAGAKWFNMPKTNLTPELKRDLQLIKMRNVLDPHRHYKKESAKAPPPEFSQVGTLVEGPTEFYSSRLQNSQRKRTLVEEVLEGEQESGRFKRKYGEIQMAKTSGRKGHYKAQMAKKYGNGAKKIMR